MSLIVVKGVYMGTVIETNTFKEVVKNRLKVDIYQPNSPAKEKMVSIISNDITLMNEFTSSYAMGDLIELEATISSYVSKKTNTSIIQYNLEKIIA